MRLKNIVTHKKGIALSEGFGAILILVLLGVLVIVGITLFVSLQATFTSIETLTTTGESLTPTTAGVLVTNSTACNFGSFGLTTAVNSTRNLIAVGNYTTSSAGAVANVTPLTDYQATPWTINYSYNWGAQPCISSQAMITQFGTYPVLVGLVGTIIFLGLVIGVLVASFVFGGRGGRV